MSTENVDPIDLLKEDLNDDDYELAINSIKRLEVISLALGPARTRAELLPFLLEYSDRDNDEALTAIAAQLGEFAEPIGGATHVPALLPLLEKLAGEEECVVRDAAVRSLVKLIPSFAPADVATKLIPLIRRLANGDWFTTRVSACGLFPGVYSFVQEQLQEELRSLFNNLCNDDTPMVRKAAYQNLGGFASNVQKQFFKTDILPILKALSTDDMDSMRIYTIECCAALSQKADANDFSSTLMPLIDALQDDTSWRVRKSFCKNCAELCKNVGEAMASKRILPLFAKLLKDKEAEVRQTAAAVMAEVCDEAKTGVLEHVVPCLDALATDQVQAVRVAFSKSVILLAGPLGKETSAKVLTPLILQLCKDEAYEVRNHVIVNIDQVADAVGPTGLQTSLLPAMLDLSKDPKWRVRMAVISKASLLAKHLGVKSFEKKLQSIMINSLSDHVYAIRERSCAQIGEIVAEYGGKWAGERFFPSAFTIYDKTTNYLHRMTCLLVISACAASCSADVIEKHLLPLVLQACTDDVPNVRLMAAKTAKELIPRADKAGLDKLKAALKRLTTDTDGDAAFFSTAALAICR